MEKKKFNLEGHDYIYYKVCFENGEIIGIKPAGEAGENVFPVIYHGLVFRSENCDEFHNYAVILKNGKPVSICYNEAEALKLCELLTVIDGEEVCYCLVPVIDPMVFSNDIIDYCSRKRDLVAEYAKLENPEMSEEEYINEKNEEFYKKAKLHW